jgi:predicted RNA-binding Zn-ribbon protein involved in translation (DUF1610 family)
MVYFMKREIQKEDGNMKLKNTLAIIVLAIFSTILLSALSGCYGIPIGTKETATVDQLKLKATGAGIVKADAKKTTYKIRCALCGFQAEDKLILTPTVKTPYIIDWLCPNCGHGQIIMIQTFAQQPLSESSSLPDKSIPK